MSHLCCTTVQSNPEIFQFSAILCFRGIFRDSEMLNLFCWEGNSFTRTNLLLVMLRCVCKSLNLDKFVFILLGTSKTLTSGLHWYSCAIAFQQYLAPGFFNCLFLFILLSITIIILLLQLMWVKQRIFSCLVLRNGLSLSAKMENNKSTREWHEKYKPISYML